jgi:hypothetical protein
MNGVDFSAFVALQVHIPCFLSRDLQSRSVRLLDSATTLRDGFGTILFKPFPLLLDRASSRSQMEGTKLQNVVFTNPIRCPSQEPVRELENSVLLVKYS